MFEQERGGMQVLVLANALLGAEMQPRSCPRTLIDDDGGARRVWVNVVQGVDNGRASVESCSGLLELWRSGYRNTSMEVGDAPMRVKCILQRS